MDYISKWALPDGEFTFDLGSLYDTLCSLSDMRKARGKRYELGMILVLIVLAKLCNRDKLTAIADWILHRTAELKAALGLTSGRLPSYSTLRRVLGEVVQAEEFEQVMSAFFAGLPGAGLSTLVVIDGKELRGTIPPGQSHGRHLLAAYLPGEGLVLRQVEVADKHNEITAAPALLKQLDLAGKTVVADAMFTQHALAATILDAGAEYVLPVKENQPTLRQDIEDLFAPVTVNPGHSPAPTDFLRVERTNRGHGRIERRTLTTSCMLNDYVAWPGLKQVFMIDREFIYCKTGKVFHEVQYGITSLSRAEAPPRRLLDILREEWTIENELHYRRDVTFGEDASRLNVGDAPRLTAAINNLVLNLLNRLGSRNIAKLRRYFDAWPTRGLALVLRRLT